ncbi:MAG: hypothetical protein QOK28_3728 [Actinomycetota bacterium]
MNDRISSTASRVNNSLTVLGTILALGGLGSIWTLFRVESRAGASHALLMTGEQASQERSAEVHQAFLTGSKETLELVNETLKLARDASQRAAHSIEAKLRTTLASLDREAKALLAKVPSQEERGLVANQTRRSELISLAHKIGGLEVNRLILEEDLPLTPACLFVRGMEFHLIQQFEDAMDCWEQVALSESAPAELRCLAWYWIGYEQNNLAAFADAEASFGRARESVAGPLDYELQRIMLESRFFNQASYAAAQLVAPFEDLLATIDREPQGEEIAARRTKIVTTLGNVHHVAGDDCRLAADAKAAKTHYSEALRLFESAQTDDKWALFGKAEALHRLGRIAPSEELYRGELRAHAINEFLNRVEWRTRTLARTTELICVARVRNASPVVIDAAYNNVIEALGQVDERMTIYSQMARRNVTQAEFRESLRQLRSDVVKTRRR